MDFRNFREVIFIGNIFEGFSNFLRDEVLQFLPTFSRLFVLLDDFLSAIIEPYFSY